MATAKLYRLPFLDNPARRANAAKEKLAEAVKALSDDITLLFSVSADVASSEEMPACETVEGLQLLQARLRRNMRVLMDLL